VKKRAGGTPPGPRGSTILEAIIAVCQRHAGWVLIVASIMSIAAVWYASAFLRINSDPDVLFSSELPFRRHAAAVESAFPTLRDQLVVVIDGDSPAVAHRAAGLLGEGLARDRAHFRSVFAPGGGTFFDRNGLLFLSVEELQDLTDRLAWAQPFLAELAREPTLPRLLELLETSLSETTGNAFSERDWIETLDLVARGLANPDAGRSGSVAWENWAFDDDLAASRNLRLVFAEPKRDFSQLQSSRAAVERIRALAARFQLDPAHGVRLRITGDLALAAEELQLLRREAGWLGIASFAWVTIVLMVGLGSVRLAIATLITLAAGLAWAAGLAALTVGSLNLLSVSFAVLFIGLGIDFGIHFALHALACLRRGADPDTSLREAASQVGPSLTVCAATTAVGFFAFLPTGYRGIAELGWIAGLGIFVSLLATLTLFPALVHRIGFSGRPGPDRRSELAVPRWLIWGTRIVALALLALACATLPELRFDSDPLNVRDPNSEAVRAFRELVAAGPVSPWTAEIVAPDLTRANQIAARLEARPEVRAAFTLDAFVPADQPEKLAILSDLAFLLGDIRPRTPAAVDPADAQRALGSLRDSLDQWLARHAGEPAAASVRGLLAATEKVLDRFRLSADDYRDVELLQMRVIGDLPEWLARLETALTTTPVRRADLPDALRKRFLTRDGLARVQVLAADDLSRPGEIERFVEAVRRTAPAASGSAFRIVESARAVTHALEQAFTYAIVAIATLLTLLWRRPTDVGLALAGLAVAALYTAASAVWLGVPLNFANVVVLPLLFGIGIDTAIHLTEERRRVAAGRYASARHATRRGVALSAVTTLGSFGCLAFSNHPGLASLGQLLALGLAWVLVVNLWIVPAFRRAATATLGRTARNP